MTIRVALLIHLSIFAHLIGAFQYARAEELRPHMVGGKFARLDSGPFALVLSSSSRCSGILVGPREVLTAAHCVSDTSPNSDFSVIVGGGVFGVKSRYYNSNYDPNGDIVLNAPHDLGILILSTAVRSIKPVPVLFNDLVTAGESAIIYGYGSNEFSALPDRYPWEDGKMGLMIVDDASGGLLTSVHTLGGASACQGDSGGPAIQTIGGFSSVIGTLTIGVNSTIGGACYLNGSGLFSYVDLQASTSQRFMLNFPGITYISGYRIYVLSVSREVSRKLKSALKSKSTTKFLGGIKPLVLSVRRAIPYSDGVRSSLLNATAKDLQMAQSTRSLLKALRLGRRALKRVERIRALGVY